MDSRGGYVSKILYVKMKESGPLGGGVHQASVNVDLPVVTYWYICTGIRTKTHTHTLMHIHIYTCTLMHTHIYTQIHTWTLTHIDTHTHTHIGGSRGCADTPPQGPRLFQFNVQNFRNVSASGVGAPLREILDPPPTHTHTHFMQVKLITLHTNTLQNQFLFSDDTSINRI